MIDLEQLSAESSLTPLRVNDLKQFEYCPRIVFYNTVMPVERKITIKMERGKKEELRLDALETRRTLKRYELGSGERRFHVGLESARLGLSGKLDLLIVSPKGLFPVDFKYTRNRPHCNHVVQLTGYALLVEEDFQTQVEILTRMLMLPSLLATLLSAGSNAARWVRSIFTAIDGTPIALSSESTCWFFSSFRPKIATEAPASARPSAMPRPIPPLPPVTTATLLARSKSSGIFNRLSSFQVSVTESALETGS